MKVAASIFSWLGWLLNIITWIVCIFNLNTIIEALQIDPTSISTTILWVFFGISAGIGIIILLWREYAVAHGHKVASGIFTLFFVSLLGGIFTLCIPTDQLG